MKTGRLTDLAIRSAQPRDKGYKLTDAGGLYLFIAPSGSRLWRLKYRRGGVEKALSIGPYPKVGLAEARRERDSAKLDLAEGKDPIQERDRRREEALNMTFELVAREWHQVNKRGWSPRHAHDVIHTLERDVFPRLGRTPIAEIRVKNVLDVLRPIERRPAPETARRVRQRMQQVFVFAAGMGLLENNPAQVAAGAMAPVIKRRQPAVATIEEARELLMRVNETPSHPITKLALYLLALTAVRPGVITSTPWMELNKLDPKRPVWQIPATRMKLRVQYKADASRAHLVPLSRQAVEVIEAMKTFSRHSPYVFPNSRYHHEPMSENAMGYLLNRAGYHRQHVPHGWRATFSTVMNERSPADFPIIEMILAHVPEKVSGAYNRARHIERRRELLQIWADLLMDGLGPSSSIVGGRRR